MNEKGVDLSKSEVIKEESQEEESTKKRELGTRKKTKSRKRKYIQNTSEDDSDKENDELRLHLTIAPDEEKEVDYEILDRKYPIKEWKTECLGTKPQFNQAEHFEEINQNVGLLEANSTYGEMLMVMFNPDDENEFWNSQQDWNIMSWKLHGSSGVHTLVTETGLVIHMLLPLTLLVILNLSHEIQWFWMKRPEALKEVPVVSSQHASPIPYYMSRPEHTHHHLDSTSFGDDEEDEEEENLAPADSTTLPYINLIPSAEDTEAFKTDESAPTPTYTSPTYAEAPLGYKAALQLSHSLLLLLALALPSSSPHYHLGPPLTLHYHLYTPRSPPRTTNHYLYPPSPPLPITPLLSIISPIAITYYCDLREDLPRLMLPTSKELCLTGIQFLLLGTGEPQQWLTALEKEGSFVSTAFSSPIDIVPTILDNDYDVKLADGKIIRVNTIIRGCTLNFLNHPFNIDLMLVELGCFDVIIGMDWISCLLAHVYQPQKKAKDEVKEKRLEDLPIVTGALLISSVRDERIVRSTEGTFRQRLYREPSSSQPLDLRGSLC
ncbi:hypothetical protein Tco_0156965 [Tanacetum coccineum]